MSVSDSLWSLVCEDSPTFQGKCHQGAVPSERSLGRNPPSKTYEGSLHLSKSKLWAYCEDYLQLLPFPVCQDLRHTELHCRHSQPQHRPGQVTRALQV